ncbi:hypothetical protein EG68_02500 [Paragonimus skrjabini miyazakii]|uniref:4-alpha-glucanotransferase n=1 Tax=Paragonimus skrjabini miyazakii TaxID=59628 RepID=A0A8S9Z4K7_9TREM|nr:hypothetical protein EG68_02500 [Paragonimus skrjabini miyazakii]
MRRIVEFILSDGMNTEGQLFRVKKDVSIHFVPDVSLIGHHVRFFINYPNPENPKIKRLEYRELSMVNPTISKQPADCFDNFFELSPLPVSGSFHFYFTVDGSAPSTVDKKEKVKISGCGYLTVDPHFGAKPSDVEIADGAVDRSWDLDGVVLQTYLPKNLGHFNEWESRLMTAKEGKYNMIHFTPLQELGYSGSAYSLRDQLKVNPTFTPPGATRPVDWTDVGKFLQHLENDWSILSMADLVFNHTSNDSPWLHKHPECAYNVVNSPHLVPAYLLDFIIWRLTVETTAGNLANVGVPARLCNPSSEIPAMRTWLNAQIEKAHLDEFFLADIPTIKQEFVSWLLSAKSSIDSVSYVSKTDSLVLKVAGKRKGRRFGGMVDFKLARKLFVGVTDHSMPFTEAAATAAANRLGIKLEELNSSKSQEVASHLQAAVDNVIANANYRFYDPHGLKLETVTLDTPIMWSYFYQPAPNVATLEEAEAVLDTPDATRIMAFNGWVINDNPLRNFAEPDSYVYLRRELVVWGDSVKLRYGDKREDCPYLWDRMAEYTELTARLFHAVRLDNCHSTPLHVAQYMLDRARAIRPNLYVVAELFTNSEYQDNIFINKLGLNSLIRESLQPHNAQALGSQLYRYGVTRPAGAFFNHIGHQQLFPSVAHALVYDQTHDNPSVAEKHCVYDFLPLAGLNAILCCAIGSTRGYDELVPHNIDVVHETRPYAKWPDIVNRQTGLIEIKSILNEMHTWLSSQGFTETFVDQCSANVIAVTRICPETRESVILVAHTAFNYDVVHQGRVDFKPIELGGEINRVLLEVQTVYTGKNRAESDYVRDSQFINGLPNVRFPFLANVDASESKMIRVERYSTKHGSQLDRLHFHNFPPGSVVVLSARLNESQEKAMVHLNAMLNTQFGCSLYKPRMSIKMGHGAKAYTPHVLSSRPSLIEANTLRMLFSELSLIDINRILFRCEVEELADGLNCGAYDVPGYGRLCYCGFESIAAVLEDIRDKNDLGHPVCAHLRSGDWLANYLCDRLCTIPNNAESILSPALVQIGKTLKQLFAPLSDLPRYLVPAYFETLILSIRQLAHKETIFRMASWIQSTSSVIKRLAIATVQFYGFIGDCRLPSPAPLLPEEVKPIANQPSGVPLHCSLSAGLPHFAGGMWRSWGRDTFIALRGCLLLTERYEDAANIILSYASLTRHGLIPNLTGEGFHVHPRYNCRDAVWYWLYAIVCYEATVIHNQSAHTSQAESGSNNTVEGTVKQVNAHAVSPTNNKVAWIQSSLGSKSLLHRPVWRWFPSNDSIGWPDEKSQPRLSLISERAQALHEVVQEVLQCHVTGIDFVERGAGPQLDEHMKPEGFRVTASVDPTTGFPRGGNAYNCGTWMDKMGSSDTARNRGMPATPRDGSAVELIGLAYAVIDWLNKANKNEDDANASYYPYAGVQLPDGKFFTWSDWLSRLKESFEPAFWIPSDTADPTLAYNRGIYRDSVGSSAGYTDNQLRPNFLVTMVLAPSLFTPERAWAALEIARERLVGPFGMRTLGTNDMAYRGDYHNDVDSTDYATAKGFNYHQGPEWLWPTGYYLRARLIFARILSANPQYKSLLNNTLSECQNTLARLDKTIRSTPWRSLPELTNSNGQFCRDSCAAQAWSVGCALEAAYDLLFTTQLL